MDGSEGNGGEVIQHPQHHQHEKVSQPPTPLLARATLTHSLIHSLTHSLTHTHITLHNFSMTSTILSLGQAGVSRHIMSERVSQSVSQRVK